MTIIDFVELLIDDCQTIELWDNNKEKVVFRGKAWEIPLKYEYEEITSIDPVQNNIIILNFGY